MEREALKRYCLHCDCEVSIEVREELQENTIKGITFPTLINNTYCTNCGNDVYIAEIGDHNLDLIDENFRTLTGRITVNEIKQLLNKYSVGAKPLSLLLGWGEVTITRYLNGQIPEKEHSDKLKSLNDPRVFRDVYEKNKNSLTPVARKKIEATDIFVSQFFSYENSIQIESLESYFKNQPDIYNGFTKFNVEKLINVILYFAITYQTMYKTKLNKLLWYCDMLSFKRTSHSITGLAYIHHYYGPAPLRHDWVFGSLGDVFIDLVENEYGAIIKPLKEFNCDIFSENELDTLQNVGSKFGMWLSGELSTYSHKEEGYVKTSQGELIPFTYASTLTLS